jgi:diguanylate cyclase (GGDEF)-like protein
MPETIIDATTQTYSFQSFMTRLKEEIESCQRYKHNVTVAAVFFDAFAELHEQLGDLAGDAVLNSIASVLRNHLQQEDFCARNNDNQSFVVILSGLSAAQASVVAQKIKHEIDTHTITYNWHNVKATVSIGLASYPTHGQAADEIVASAVTAAHFALNAGGDRIVIA